MTNKTIQQPAREIPVLGAYDVIVIGSGPAGCAAACAAAREGARTLLVEKFGYLGGTPVAKLITPILSTNAVDFQGIWHDWARALQRRGGISDITRQQQHTANWYVGNVDPEIVKHAWDDLVTAAGADLLHFCHVIDTLVENGVATGIVAATRNGVGALCARRLVDCTGDGVVCAAAGCDWVSGANGLPYAMGVSLGARVGGITCDADTVPGQPHGKYGMGRVMPGCHQAFLWAARILETDPLDPWAVTAAMRQGRAELWHRMQDLRQIPGNERIFLIESAQDLGVRSSRRVTGIATVTHDDAWSFRKQPGSMARSSWEIDIHSARELNKSAVDFDDPAYRRRIEQTKSGEYFDIPYGCLVPVGVDGLLVAGRCLSAEHEAQASLRIQQTCMATGEAAGLAAALSIERNLQPAELPAETVAAELQRRRDAVEPAFDVIAAAPIRHGGLLQTQASRTTPGVTKSSSHQVRIPKEKCT